MELDRLDEQLAQPFHEFVLGGVLVRLELDVPVPFDPHARPPAAAAIRAGSSLRTPFTMLACDGVARNVKRWPTASQFERRSISGQLQNRLELGREDEAVVALVRNRAA